MLIIGLLLTVGLLNAAVALIVLSRNVKKPLNFFYFLLATSTAVWVFGIAAFINATTTDVALNFAKLFYVAPLLIGLASLVFADVFPSGGMIKKPKAGVMLAGFVVLTGLIIFSPNFLFTELRYHEWGKEVVLSQTGYMLYSFYLALAFLMTLGVVYKKTLSEKGLYRAQASTFFNGYLISCVVGVYFNLIMPGLGNYRLIWIGPLATTAYIVATGYGIVRHRLFDIRLIIARSLGYVATIVTLSFLYGFLIFGLGQLIFDVSISIQAQIFFSAATGLVALTFQKFKSLFDRATNRIFYRDAYDPQELFDEYNKALVSTIDLDLMLKRTSAVIAKYLKSEYCVIGVKDGTTQEYRILGTKAVKFEAVDINIIRQITPHIHHAVIVVDDIPPAYIQMQSMLQKYDIAMLVRLTTNLQSTQEGQGYIALGTKKSGNLYTSQDVKVVETLANELIIALQNALRFEEIERFNETLQAKINVATRRLSESNHKLKVLNETKDDFIGMASHQLRTPLTSVKGYLSLVIDGDAGKVNTTQKKLLTQAFISSQRMVYLIADLLNVSRLRTGKFVVERAPTNIAAMISDELEQLREMASSRGIDLTFEAPENFPSLPLDETKTRQVIMNFMDNAIYYTPSGGHVRAELRDLPMSVELRVIDDGIGVPKDEAHHMFTKFYRAKNAQRARPDGTGLGLFMAKKVIVAQGGALIFNSKEGEGSTFGFSFPKDLPTESETTSAISAD